ncbi:hypothetical protein BKA81DRAFT_190188 [Phyllosticta paracitricarpa]
MRLALDVVSPFTCHGTAATSLIWLLKKGLDEQVPSGKKTRGQLVPLLSAIEGLEHYRVLLTRGIFLSPVTLPQVSRHRNCQVVLPTLMVPYMWNTGCRGNCMVLQHVEPGSQALGLLVRGSLCCVLSTGRRKSMGRWGSERTSCHVIEVRVLSLRVGWTGNEG